MNDGKKSTVAKSKILPTTPQSQTEIVLMVQDSLPPVSPRPEIEYSEDEEIKIGNCSNEKEIEQKHFDHTNTPVPFTHVQPPTLRTKRRTISNSIFMELEFSDQFCNLDNFSQTKINFIYKIDPNWNGNQSGNFCHKTNTKS